MLRSLFIALSKAYWAQRWISRWGLAWRVASRFIAGETVEQALRAVQVLNQQGLLATLDQLGENTQTVQDAEQAAQGILHLLEEIERAGVQANVSVKLSQLGLVIDPQLVVRHLRQIVEKARQLNNFIRVDMEDSTLTDATLKIVADLRDSGLDNVGTVIQSYLYRSMEDTQKLIERGIKIRLVKGAYQEPPHLAYPKKRDVDAAFDRLSDLLIDTSLRFDYLPATASGRFPPLAAIATHDEKRIEHAIQRAKSCGLPVVRLEFQMLYGIRRDLQLALVKQGYPVRIYVPFGTHWYPYFMRRLAERPANVWFFVSNLFQR
ncbi:proline dehydrogenase family protein [Bellilinea sp.]|uniref:proline dehydrogenase family protein n=1 Tax=Bellilinea sp. TaxID=2838785 RepID=UPI002ADE5ACC|nr:proline dehydrogenase family protein [Bellilinea sp.]